MRLTAHFTLNELLRNSGASAPPDRVVVNAKHTAAVLEQVRRELGDVPIIIGSWYRSPEKNAALSGASPTSAHLTGYGVDFNVPGMTPREIVDRLAPIARQLRIDQLIDERDHVHLSADPRARAQVLYEPIEGEYVAAPTALPPVTITANSGKGGNAKVIAILTAIGTIVGAVIKLLSE